MLPARASAVAFPGACLMAPPSPSILQLCRSAHAQCAPILLPGSSFLLQIADMGLSRFLSQGYLTHTAALGTFAWQAGRAKN